MIIYHQTNKEGQAGGQVGFGIGQPGSFTFYSSLALNPEASVGLGYLQAAIRGFRSILIILSGVEA